MKEYNKIQAPFKRDVETKKVIRNVYSDQTIEFLKDVEWEWTEKIDGTNIRVFWDGHKVTFGGRTDAAQIPSALMNRLNELFSGDENEEIFEQTFGDKPVVLYGEGYGLKIQGVGAQYIKDGVDFILFDVEVNNTTLNRYSVDEVAEKLGVKSVPVIMNGTIDNAVEFMKQHPDSTIGTAPMEGLVGRPKLELFNRVGRRVITKVKWSDVKDLM